MSNDPTISQIMEACNVCKYWAMENRHKERYIGFFGVIEFDIDKAKELTANHKIFFTPTKSISDALMLISITQEHVQHVDPEIPILIATLPKAILKALKNSVPPHLPIDGHHRIARAVRENREVIPYRLLTAQETNRIILMNRLPHMLANRSRVGRLR